MTKLTNQEAAIVLGMLNRDDKHQDIAAWFGINQGRIAEVEQGSHGNISPAPAKDLPPKGAPGIKGRLMREEAENALKALNANNPAKAKNILQQGIKKYDSNLP